MSLHASPKSNIVLGTDDGNPPPVLASGLLIVDCSKGNIFEALLGGDCVFQIENLYPGETLSIHVIQDGAGSHSIAFTGETIQRATGSSLDAQSGPDQSTTFFFIGVDGETIRLIANEPGGGGSSGNGQSVVYSTLPDADTTVTPKAGANGFNATTLTALRTYTIDSEGSKLGDVCVMQRTDTSVFGMFVAYDGNKTIRMGAPSLVWFQHNGLDYQPVYSTARVGDNVRYITDFYNDDGSRVAGDGKTHNSTGINRAIQSLVAPGGIGPCGALHAPAGIYLCEANLIFFGGGDNYSSFRFSGDNGGDRGATGTLFKYIGPASPDDSTGTQAFFHCIGVSGSVFEDFDIHCNSLQARGMWHTIESTDGSSETNQVKNVAIYLPREGAVGSFGFGSGPEFDTPGLFGSDVAFVSWHKCIVEYAGKAVSADMQGASWSFRQWNNTKDFALYDCASYYARYAIEWPFSSGSMFISNMFFQSSLIDVIKHTGSLFMAGCNTEGSAQAMQDTGGGPDSLTMSQWAWNGTPLDDNNVVLDVRGQTTIDGCWFRNFRNFTSITTYNGTAGTVTVLSPPVIPMSEGDHIAFFVGSGSLPAGIIQNYLYSVLNVTTDPLTNTTSFQLALAGTPSTPITFTGEGVSGNQSIASPSVIVCADPQPGNVSECSLSIANSWFTGMFDYLNVRPTAAGQLPVLDPNSSFTAPKILGGNNFGGIYNGYTPLRNREGIPSEYQQLSMNLGSSDEAWRLVFMGGPDLPDVWELDFARMFALQSFRFNAYAYLDMTKGEGIEWAVIDVVQAFTGTGLTSCKAWVGEAPNIGSLLGVNDATGIDLTTTGFKGRTTAELGAKWADSVLGAVYNPSVGGWQISVMCNVLFSNLTAGKAFVRIKRRYMQPYDGA